MRRCNCVDEGPLLGHLGGSECQPDVLEAKSIVRTDDPAGSDYCSKMISLAYPTGSCHSHTALGLVGSYGDSYASRYPEVLQAGCPRFSSTTPCSSVAVFNCSLFARAFVN